MRGCPLYRSPPWYEHAPLLPPACDCVPSAQNTREPTPGMTGVCIGRKGNIWVGLDGETWVVAAGTAREVQKPHDDKPVLPELVNTEAWTMCKPVAEYWCKKILLSTEP